MSSCEELEAESWEVDHQAYIRWFKTTTLITARQELLAVLAEEQIRFAAAKELLAAQPEAEISQEALVACAEADEAMDRLHAAILRVERLQTN
jgi:hypothetical protein